MWVFDRLREGLRRRGVASALPSGEVPSSGPAEGAEPAFDDVALRSTAMRDRAWADNLARIEGERARQEIQKERAATDQRIRLRAAAWVLASGTALLGLVVGVPVTRAIQGQAVTSLGIWTLLLLLVLGTGIVVGVFYLIARLLRGEAGPSGGSEVRETAASSDQARLPGQRTAPAASAAPEAGTPDSGGAQ